MDRTGNYQVLDPLEAPEEESGGVPSVEAFLACLEASRLLSSAEQESFFAENPKLLNQDTAVVVEALVNRGLLSDYQASRLLAGRTFGLVLGNYRIVDRLSNGGMGVVYEAEYVHMKRTDALKVLFLEDEDNPVFYSASTARWKQWRSCATLTSSSHLTPARSRCPNRPTASSVTW